MDFKIYPYGNAKQLQAHDGSWKFHCQHGPKECVANTLEVCAMYYHNASVTDWFPFIDCVERSDDPSTAGAVCSKKVGWSDYDSLIAPCVTGELGNSLQHKVGVQTDNLQPPHKFTPWVVMNGTPLSSSDIGEPLESLVCKAYKGPNVPPACKKWLKKPVSVCFRNITVEDM